MSTTPLSVAVTPLTSVPHDKPRTRPRLLVSIEGNIGIGKSTLLNRLRAHFKNDVTVAFVDEPVDLWEAFGLLKAMYTRELDRCAFQIMALCTRFAALTQVLRNQPEADLIITERSVHSDSACFAAVNLEAPADVAAYKATYDSLIASLPEGLTLGTILLDAPVATLVKRIAKRGRGAENEEKEEDDERNTAGGDTKKECGIPGEYLSKLDAAHAKFYEGFADSFKCRVDATQTPDGVASAVIAATQAIYEAHAPSVAGGGDAAIISPVTVLAAEGAAGLLEDCAGLPAAKKAKLAPAALPRTTPPITECITPTPIA